MMTDSEREEEGVAVSDRIDFLFKIINRYDTYITSTNTKASLVIAWNGVVIGTILLKHQEILNQFKCENITALASILLVICGIASLISIGLVFGVVFPFLRSNLDGSDSLIFFGSVAKVPPDEYCKTMRIADNLVLLNDISRQVTVLAVGLTSKMHYLQNSINAIYVQLAALAIIVILLAI
jgi:hypothetical protein